MSMDRDKTTNAAGSHAPDQAPTPTPTDAELNATVESITSGVNSIQWAAGDYAPAITTEAQTRKLQLSAIAPLVAIADGQRTITLEQAKDVGEMLLGGSPNSGPRRQFKRLCTPAALLMPHHSIEGITHARRDAAAVGGRMLPPRPAYQARPDNAAVGSKYENITGEATILGVHASTPLTWIESAPVLLAEGRLKGLAAITGILLAAGFTPADLTLTEPEKNSSVDVAIESARDRLHDMMATIEPAQRHLVLTVVGVGNWHSNPEWSSLNLRGGRRFILGFDGDLRDNANIYRQAEQMFHLIETKGGTPSWLDIPHQGLPDKPGIDDYLLTNTLTDLLGHELTELPDPPAPDKNEAGHTARMNEEKVAFEELKDASDSQGQTSGKVWVKASDVIGRISALIQRRPATEDELRTGRFDTRAHEEAEGDIALEVAYQEPGGATVRTTITGPSRMLTEKPDRWARSKEIHLPSKISLHPDWPPRHDGWLPAAKRHREEERSESFVWAQMGWVPTIGGVPVFIAGSKVVGIRGEMPEEATPGITEREMPGASTYGLSALTNTDGSMDTAAVAGHLRTVLDTFTAGAWRSEGVAAIALAGALRPTVPVLPHSVIYFSGQRRSGKALPLDTPIVTRGGPAHIRDIRIGDEVLAGDGTWTRVRDLSEVHLADCHSVILDDGRSLNASSNHLWRIRQEAHARAAHPDLPAAVSEQLQYISSAQAAHVEDIAALVNLPVAELQSWLDAAGTPSETFGPGLRVYPIGEALALAGLMSAMEPGAEVPYRTVTTAQLGELRRQGAVEVSNGDGTWTPVAGVRATKRTWVRCLTVEHHSGLFRAGAHPVTTHNSWTAKQMMSFWQQAPATFKHQLPGTASDTMYYMENCLAHSPIWCADDLAPSIDKRKQQAAEARIGDIIRSVFNRRAKGRMNSDQTSREMLTPRALLLVTSENAQSAASEMDRVVHINTGEDFFGPEEAKDACDALAERTLSANHVTAAAIQMIADSVNEHGSWEEVVKLWNAIRAEQRVQAMTMLGGHGKAARHADMAADLMVGLVVLRHLALHVDLEDAYLQRLQAMKADLVGFIGVNYFDSNEMSPGSSIIQALRSALTSGACHVAHPSSGEPPYTHDSSAMEAARVNKLLGWSYPSIAEQGERPNGRRIGDLVYREDAWYVLFDPHAAFTEAQKAHPELILAGSRQEATWTSAWTEGLAGGPWARKQDRGGRRRSVCRTANGERVPVPLSVLVDFGTEDPSDTTQGMGGAW